MGDPGSNLCQFRDPWREKVWEPLLWKVIRPKTESRVFQDLQARVLNPGFSHSPNTASQVDYTSAVMNWKSIRGFFSPVSHTPGEEKVWLNKINWRTLPRSSVWQPLGDYYSSMLFPVWYGETVAGFLMWTRLMTNKTAQEYCKLFAFSAWYAIITVRYY